MKLETFYVCYTFFTATLIKYAYVLYIIVRIKRLSGVTVNMFWNKHSDDKSLFLMFNK